ncbi:S26 family signal peptidase [Micromonospora sp. NPDC049559]|uniref:S26 family signal peptidase n=1 Tax=Micromonospora sp. NPDC049559 TaxID=3155923 RepID=UPI0034249D58
MFVLIGAVALAFAGAVGTAVLARRRLVAVTVEGNSMSPALHDGDRVLVARRRLPRVRTGDIVVVERPRPGSGWRDLPPPGQRLPDRQWYVKRAVALPGDPVPARVRVAAEADVVPPDALVVIGDNPNSNDSKQWGFFPADRLLGVVVARLPGQR